MLGAILFLIFFLFVAPVTRNAIFAMLDHARDSIIAFAPVSYIVLLVTLIAAPLMAYQLMVHWPAPEEPENPMARYKREADNLDVEP